MLPISVFSALADPTRCRIVEILHRGSQPVHVLAASFSISRPAISRHLRVLREAGLVSEKKVGRENLYVVHPDRLEPAHEWLSGFTPPVSEPAMAADEVHSQDPALEPARLEAQPVETAQHKAPKPRKPATVSQMGFDF